MNMMAHRSAISAMAISIIMALASCGSQTAEGSMRILAVETIAGKSHWNFMSSVLRALTDAGHNVTVFTPFTDGDREHYTEVDLSDVFPKKLDMDLSEVLSNFSHLTSIIPTTVVMSRELCNVVYDHERMKAILQAPDTSDDVGFDMVIVEPLGSDCVSYVAAVLRLPMIYTIPMPMITHQERAFLGHVPNPATVSHLLAGHAVPVTFVQRFSNAILLAYSMFMSRYTQWKDVRTAPKPYDLMMPIQPSAVFVNSHFATEASRPTLPNVVHVGGVHLKKPKSIPHDILEFIEGSANGVIYFTFGSVVKMSTFPKHIQKAFKDSLAQIPQRILWKYEGEMEDLPQNVMIKKWFPQRDILLHPNIKLFISHGGISGVYETVDAGVPVLGFPLFYDQHRNIANLVNNGMAISMELLSVTKETFLNSVLELLNNKNYSINAKIASERFKDRPMSAEKSIVYWTEYIHRHKGAAHLKSHALDLAWYQYFLVDVFATMLTIIFIILFVCSYILKFILNYSLRCTSKYVKAKSE